ncbi:DUF4282 domain-containing protein (plasmid) [Spirillospora sp. CA-255316]
MGLIGALADTRFRTLATPHLVTWIYRGCMAVIAMMTLWWIVLALWVLTWRNGWLWGLLGLIAAPLVGGVLLLAVRVVLEFVMLRFRLLVPAPGPARAADQVPGESPRGREHG